MEKCWEIRESGIENSGAGVFATRDISPGEIILEDKEYFDVSSNYAPNWILELKNSFEDKSVNGIIRTNKISLRGKSYVYRTFSKFNHSCNPNVENFFNGLDIIVGALKPIKKGDELFLTYFKSLQFLDSDSLHSSLKEVFNFDCGCNIDRSSWQNIVEDAKRVCSNPSPNLADQVISKIEPEHPLLASLIAIRTSRNYLALANKYRLKYMSIMGPMSKNYPGSEPQKLIRMMLSPNIPINI